MRYARAIAFAAIVAAGLRVSTPVANADGSVFDGTSVVALTLRAPFEQLFGDRQGHDTVPVAVSYADAVGHPAVPLGPAEVSIRGNTSRKDCSFPKLKLKFRDGAKAGPFDRLHGVRINTHCGEDDGERLDPTYGRLANEKSPWREGVVYALLDAAGVRVPRVRLARITYIDTSPTGTIVPSPLTRNALLLEEDEDTVERLDGDGTVEPAAFTTAHTQFAPEDSARLAFAEAMVGNFDWCLMFAPGDSYRCDARRKLWNLLAVQTGSTVVPVLQDFDLAGMVTGRHPWFDDVFTRDYAPTAIETEAIAQTQRTRTLFGRELLDRTRQAFLDRRAAIYDTLTGAIVDAHGRQLARAYLDAFFAAIETNEAFYRPVVVRDGVRIYADPAATRDACGIGDTVPPGTPAKILDRRGSMARVQLLDALWRWAPPNECLPVHRGAVWMDASAIGRDFPPVGSAR